MMGEERRNSFMAEIPITKKTEQTNGLVSIQQGPLS